MYCGFIIELKNVRPHSNADRMLLADCPDGSVCVSLEAYNGQIGLFLPVDGQVSVEFGEQNNLLRKKDENGVNIGGYLDPDKRNIRALTLRGERSNGIFLPIDCLNYCYEDSNASKHLSLGDQITVVNGHDICQKFIPVVKGKKVRQGCHVRNNKVKKNIAPLFKEHIDTEQLNYNLGQFKCGDLVEVSLKMHGTSQRTAHVPVLKGYKRTFWDKILKREGTPIYEYDYITGTRRVVLDTYDGGFYGSNEFREQHAKVFEGKLPKGWTVYYEVVGFTHTGAPIMATGDNGKLGKEFVKQYGKTTTFSYGCTPQIDYRHGHDDMGDFSIPTTKQSDIYVYRITVTNDDGDVIDLMPWEIQRYCDLWGVKKVPTLWSGMIPMNPGTKEDDTVTAGEWVKAKAEQYYDGPDPIGKTHVREGTVVRILNRSGFAAYKTKNFSFKMLSGLTVENISAEAEIDEDLLSEM